MSIAALRLLGVCVGHMPAEVQIFCCHFTLDWFRIARVRATAFS